MLVLIAVGLHRYTPYTGAGMMPKQPPAVVLAMEDVYLVGLNHKGKLWSAKAEKVEIGQNRLVTKLTSIHDGKIYDSGKVALKVKAKEAVYHTYQRDLSLNGGVEILGNDGQKVTGQGAIWNSNTSSLRSIGQVHYISKMGNIAADQLMVNVKNKELTMWNVKMRIKLDALEQGLAEEATSNAR